MKTFILEWDPATSNYKDEDFMADMGFLEFGKFIWKVREHEGARSGDNFYLVRCGVDPAGIVMKGFFTSDPYRKADRGGTDAYFMDIRPTFMVCPRHPRGILSTGILNEAMPGFGWDGSPSGRELPGAYRPVLDRIWVDYEERFEDEDFDGVLADRSRRPEAGIDEAVALAAEALFDRKDWKGSPLILSSLSAGLGGRADKERVCGFLLPVLKHTYWKAGDLRERGFSEGIVDSLTASLN